MYTWYNVKLNEDSLYMHEKQPVHMHQLLIIATKIEVSQLHADSCKDSLCLIKMFDALTGNCPLASEDNVTPLTNIVTAGDLSSWLLLDGVTLLDTQ